MRRNQILRRFLAVALSAVLILGAAPMTAAADASVDITGKEISSVKAEIEAALASGGIVTVTGAIANAAETLEITIPAGEKVIWRADISIVDGCVISLPDDGAFEVAEGGSVSITMGTAIYADGDSSTVTVSGNGRVQATGSGWAIAADGTVEVKDSAVVSTATGTAIHAYSNATVVVSGGTVSATTGKAINADGGSSVIVRGNGRVQATGAVMGLAICTLGNVEIKDSAVVSSNYQAIQAMGDGTVITVSGGTVSTTENLAINASGHTDVTVCGSGRVQATEDGWAISTYGNVEVKDSAVVSARTLAINVDDASSTVTISGGLVFAYGSAVTGEDTVIYPRANDQGFTGATGTGVVIAWDYDAGNRNYPPHGTGDITLSPSSGAQAYWSNNAEGTGGIAYKNGANEGLIPLAGVTVEKITLTAGELTYTIPADHVYNGVAQGIGAVSVTSADFTATTGGTLSVEYGGSTAIPKNAGTYAVTAVISGGTEYNAVTLPLGNYTIAKKQLTLLSGTAADKVYDGSDSANVTGIVLGGLAGGETLEFGVDYTVTGIFDSANAGTNKNVTITPALNATAAADNYSMSGTMSTTASITAKQITGAVTVDVTNGGDAALIDAGDTLTADLTGITTAGATMSCQWYRAGAEISGATGSTYIVGNLSVDPAGTEITVTVTGTGNYTGSISSGAVEVGRIPLGGGISINGTAEQGQTLTLDISALTPADAAYTVKWLRGGAEISGQTGTTYTVLKDDLGKTLSVLVTGTGNYSGTVTANKAIPAVTPDAPLNLSAARGSGQVTLTWTAAFSGGSAITKYEVSKDDGASWTDAGLALSYTFTGLTNGTAYTFKVRALNAAGTGAEASVTATPESSGGGGGGGGTNDKPDTQTVVSGDGKSTETKVGGATDETGKKSEAAVTGGDVKQLLEKAAEGSKGLAGVKTIEFDVETDSGVSQVGLNIPASSFKELADSTNAGVTVSTGIGSVTFNARAVESIAGAGTTGDVSVTIEKLDAASLPDSVKNKVGDRPVYDFTVTSGGKTVSDFGGGRAEVSLPYTPKPGENPNAVVVYYVDDSGKLQTVRGRYDPATGTVNFTVKHFSQYAVGYNPVHFIDVPGGAWYEDAVGFIAARSITLGTGDGMFSPNAKITRGEFIVLLMRAYDIDPEENPSGNFSDAGNTYYTGYLAAAKHLGISSGVGGNMFAPSREITRQEMLTLLYNALDVIGALPDQSGGKTLSDFSDAGLAASWARDAVALFTGAGIIEGSGGMLNPEGLSSRAEMAQILYKLLSK